MQVSSMDHLDISKTPYLVNSEPVYLSATVIKYGNLGMRNNCSLVITDKALYEINKNTIKNRVLIEKIDALSKSTLSSEFIVHLKDDYDLRFLSYDFRDQIIETLLYVICNIRKLCKAFPLYMVANVSLSKYTTSYHIFQSRKCIRPPEDTLVMMNLDKYKDSEVDSEESSATNKRRKTEVLFYQSQPVMKEIGIEDFELLKVLGQGAFGKVFLARHRATMKIYAMKVLKKKNIIETNQLEHTKTEKMILQHVNHPFIVNLEFAFQTADKLYFVLEFMKGGELFNYLSKVDKIGESAAKFYAASVALALGHLHKNNYIYRDIKPENILLDDYGYAKLVDFGLAKFLRLNEQTHTLCGTPEYLAPEVLLGKGHNRPADWWGLGILIYEMLTGTTPFRASNIQTLYTGIVKKEVSFRNTSISVAGRDIIKKLLNKNSSARLGAKADDDEVLSHPWFAEINLPDLLKRKLIAPYKPLVKGNDWEKNFGPFISEKLKESVNTVDAEVLRNLQKEFEGMNYNKNSQP